jgi:tetratricopeptide (TPR) repeat protein
MVTRLDGPTAAIANGLVDRALQGEANGLWGRCYFDLRGLTEGSYKTGDDMLRATADMVRMLGFETIVDNNPGTFPADFPMSQIAFYAGWYDENASGPFAQPSVEFMPGAFAYHLHSFSASTLRSSTRQWVGPLLAKGVTATMGCVDEPYLGGTPQISIFAARWIYSGFSFGEAAYAAQSVLSWQTTVVGDPLYRPFGTSLKERYVELMKDQSPYLEWAYVNMTNLRLIKPEPVASVSFALEELPLSEHSAVLMEKLAALYDQEGKPASAIHALQQAIELDPSPLQGVRLMLHLRDKLIAAGDYAEAYRVSKSFIQKYPAYPNPLPIYRELAELAQKLGKTEDAAKYDGQVRHLSAN